MHENNTVLYRLEWWNEWENFWECSSQYGHDRMTEDHWEGLKSEFLRNNPRWRLLQYKVVESSSR